MASALRTASRVRPAIANFNAQHASRTASIARRQYATHGEQPLFPGEPTGPTVKTQIPGPESQKAIERLSKVFDTRSLNMMADYTRSSGN